MGHHSYHITLDFCEMNSVFVGIFRVLFFGKYFLGFSLRGKVFFGVVQKYPTPLIPVCRFVKSTPPPGHRHPTALEMVGWRTGLVHIACSAQGSAAGEVQRAEFAVPCDMRKSPVALAGLNH